MNRRKLQLVARPTGTTEIAGERANSIELNVQAGKRVQLLVFKSDQVTESDLRKVSAFCQKKFPSVQMIPVCVAPGDDLEVYELSS